MLLEGMSITDDRVDQKRWISKDGGNIQEVAMDGAVVREFYPGDGRWTALAWEPSTDTLWANNFGSNTFRQWQEDGTLIEEVTIDGLLPYVLGGEFAVPEPAFVGLSLPLLLLTLIRCWIRHDRVLDQRTLIDVTACLTRRCS